MACAPIYGANILRVQGMNKFKSRPLMADIAFPVVLTYFKLMDFHLGIYQNEIIHVEQKSPTK